VSARADHGVNAARAQLCPCRDRTGTRVPIRRAPHVSRRGSFAAPDLQSNLECDDMQCNNPIPMQRSMRAPTLVLVACMPCRLLQRRGPGGGVSGEPVRRPGGPVGKGPGAGAFTVSRHMHGTGVQVRACISAWTARKILELCWCLVQINSLRGLL
jgi:hypothetical protein